VVLAVPTVTCKQVCAFYIFQFQKSVFRPPDLSGRIHIGKYGDLIPRHYLSFCLKHDACNFPCIHENGYGSILYPNGNEFSKLRVHINNAGLILKHEIRTYGMEWKVVSAKESKLMYTNFQNIHERNSYKYF
jgi:hypothetical protein